MTLPPVKTEAVTQEPAVVRLQRAFTQGYRPDWKEVRAAILAGAPVDTLIPSRSGSTTLAIATIIGNVTEVGWLLDHGAALESVNPDGETTLVRAVAHSCTGPIALLLQRGANPNVKSRDGTPALSINRDPTIVRLLLAKGADPNARDRDDWPVWMAMVLMNVSTKGLIATLIDHGADPSATTPDGRTAPEIFMANGHSKLTGCLDEALIGERHAAARHRLLDQLTVDQRLAWLPKSSAAEAARAACTAWCRAAPSAAR